MAVLTFPILVRLSKYLGTEVATWKLLSFSTLRVIN